MNRREEIYFYLIQLKCVSRKVILMRVRMPFKNEAIQFYLYYSRTRYPYIVPVQVVGAAQLMGKVVPGTVQLYK
jgi:hypothetical protein